MTNLNWRVLSFPKNQPAYLSTVEQCYVARANVLESANPGVDWVAWADGEYSLHYVHPQAFTAARYVLDQIYGTELA